MRRKWCETAVSSATDYSTLKVCFGGTSNTFEAVDAKNAEKAFSLVYKMACVGLEGGWGGIRSHLFGSDEYSALTKISAYLRKPIEAVLGFST